MQDTVIRYLAYIPLDFVSLGSDNVRFLWRETSRVQRGNHQIAIAACWFTRVGIIGRYRYYSRPIAGRHSVLPGVL